MIRYLLPALLLATPARADIYEEMRLFPSMTQATAAREIVKREIHLLRCPALKRGPKAAEAFQNLIKSYSYGAPITPDVPGIKNWIRGQIAEKRSSLLPRYPTDWCEATRRMYGAQGIKPNQVVEQDGSPAYSRCFKAGTCSAANSFDVYVY